MGGRPVHQGCGKQPLWVRSRAARVHRKTTRAQQDLEETLFSWFLRRRVQCRWAKCREGCYKKSGCASHAGARFPELLGTQPRYHLLCRAGACLSSLSPSLMMPVGVLVTLITVIDSCAQYSYKSPGFGEFPASTELCTLAQHLLLPLPISHNK